EVPVLEHRDEHIRASTLEVEAATILPEAVRLAGISCLYDQVRPVEGDQACERRARELRVPEQRGGQLCLCDLARRPLGAFRTLGAFCPLKGRQPLALGAHEAVLHGNLVRARAVCPCASVRASGTGGTGWTLRARHRDVGDSVDGYRDHVGDVDGSPISHWQLEIRGRKPLSAYVSTELPELPVLRKYIIGVGADQFLGEGTGRVQVVLTASGEYLIPAPVRPHVRHRVKDDEVVAGRSVVRLTRHRVGVGPCDSALSRQHHVDLLSLSPWYPATMEVK